MKPESQLPTLQERLEAARREIAPQKLYCLPLPSRLKPPLIGSRTVTSITIKHGEVIDYERYREEGGMTPGGEYWYIKNKF